jgi:hypothetical protein
MRRPALLVSVLGFALGSACGQTSSDAGRPGDGTDATDATTGGSAGSDGGADAACVAEGDRCVAGSPVVPCLVGYDCCRNICGCGADGRVSCSIVCGPEYGSGGNCGADGAAGSSGAIGDGGLEAGVTCTTDQDCASGLKCCYPCGIPDCQNVCMKPDFRGSCPLFL